MCLFSPNVSGLSIISPSRPRYLCFSVLLCATSPPSKALESAWKDNYAGNYHKILWDNILGLPKDAPYSRQITVVQSSGTGKSRTIHELSKLVFTIPFNLRPSSDSKGLHCSIVTLSSSNVLAKIWHFHSLTMLSVTTSYRCLPPRAFIR